ncbi:TRAP transporter permease [Natrinema versiforme]|uniref:TRAP transporter, 4TM/12TM fusion protein n=1 Tax=Natrinema versiforme JCM 10478 TaxID=1227496 RepID=L9XQX6_9EURY|nr:TRAP transporter fused permease subunit [Natrinema versiforme]ELY62988.1 TRAP transporter, 4TM/12TM fusion protein [Natrinema versiforme JCM 10478]
MERKAIAAASIPFWAFIIFYAVSQQMPRSKFSVAFFGTIATIYVINEFLYADEPKPRYESFLLVASGIVVLLTSIYLFTNFETLYTERLGYALAHEYWMAFAFVLAMLYLTYREFGVLFLSILLGVIGYGLFGSVIPGVLGHGGIAQTRLLRILVIEIDGFYGQLTGLVAAWLSLFLLYAGLLKAYGAFDLMIRLAVYSSKYVRSGVAQSAVIASIIIGSINGSTAANTAMTGSFTIPLMKKNGLRSETAGGIEAVASTVGQVLPPVMGAGAFVMASLLGMDYGNIVIAGTLPALILVSSIAIGVHYTSVAQTTGVNIDVSDFIDENKSRADLAIEGVKFAIPFVVLIYTLGIAQYTVMTAALYTVISTVTTGISVPLLQAFHGSGSVRSTAKRTILETVDGARIGVLSLAGIAIIISAIDGVVTILLATGVPSALTLALMDLSGGILLVAAFIAMVVSIVLGLGMPTVAAYLIVALLIAPTLSGEFGVPQIAAHFFVFYCAILAAITPPIATSVAVATGIAESNFWGTSLEAIKISIPLFVLPFAFVYNPELVAGGLTLETFIFAGITFVGAVSLVHGINYIHRPFGLSVHADWGLRSLFVVAGVITMVYPDLLLRGGIAAAVVLAITIQHRSRSNPLSADDRLPA